MTRGIIEPLPVTFDEAVKRVVKKRPEGKKGKIKEAKSSGLKAANSKQKESA